MIVMIVYELIHVSEEEEQIIILSAVGCVDVRSTILGATATIILLDAIRLICIDVPFVTNEVRLYFERFKCSTIRSIHAPSIHMHF